MFRVLGRLGEAREQQERCLDLTREMGDVDGEAAATINLGNVCLVLGDTDYATVKLVRDAQIPSLKPMNPDVPPGLSEIVTRAMSVDKARRFQTMDELRAALERYL